MQEQKCEPHYLNEELCKQVCVGLSHALSNFRNTVQLVEGPLIRVHYLILTGETRPDPSWLCAYSVQRPD
jgi:hypothetical protein